MVFIYIAVYALISFFFVIENVLRKGKDAKTFEKSKYDNRSTVLLGFTFVTSVLLLMITPLLNHYRFGNIKTNLFLNGFSLLIMLSGITIRITAAITLGRFYTRTLRKTDNHVIVSNGLYKYIRHPGYLGTMLVFWGAGLAVGNVISLSIITILILIAYLYRIKVEEKMLNDIFGDQYQIYAKRTKRLLPFIY